MLKGERGDLAASLHNLGIAMRQVSGFVRDNREVLGKNIAGLDDITQILVKQRAALGETLRNAPLALNNLALTYNPQAGTLDTRANLGEIGNQITSDPATFLCGILDQANQGGQACSAIQQLLGKNRPGALGGASTSAGASGRPTSPTRRSADSWRPADDAPPASPQGRGRPRGGGAGARPAARSTRTSCRCPAAPTSADDPITVTAQFRDVLDLVPDSTVKVNDVTVGKITDVRLQGYHALVTMQLRNDTELPDNAVATIQQTSLLGEKFVAARRSGRPESQPAAHRRRDHDGPHRAEPGGRGGPRSTQPAAERRWRRPAADDHPRAEQDAARPRGRRPVGPAPDPVVQRPARPAQAATSSPRSRRSTGCPVS